MCYTPMNHHFTGIVLFFCMILHDLSNSNISAYAASYNSSEEIKNIFSLSHGTNYVPKGVVNNGNFAEGGLIDDNFIQSKSNASLETSSKNLSSHNTVSTFTGLVNGLNISSSKNINEKKNFYTFQTTSVKTLLPSKLIETGSSLFLGVPEVIHINGASSIKPRKGVHYSKIVPRKGVDNENEAFHVSVENQSCFWFNKKECYSNKEMFGFECSCCTEGNALGKNVKQAPVNCTICKTFNILTSKENQTCENICCNATNDSYYSVTSTQNIYKNNEDYQIELSTEKRQQSFSLTDVSEKILFGSDFLSKANLSKNMKKNSKFKPHITKVPYDAESMTELLGKAQQKVFVPLVVSLFLLPLMGIIIFFLWQKAKEYWNKRYYKKMDFLIDGIYND